MTVIEKQTIIEKQTAILCVDDEEVVTSTLRSLLTQFLPEVTVIEVATDAEEALEVIEEFDEDGIVLLAVISDYIMPNTKGDELLIKIHELHPKAKKIMLTGQSDISGVTRAINKADLYRFIEKPWHNDDLLLTLRGAISAYQNEQLIKHQNTLLTELNEQLEIKVAERTRELEEKTTALEKAVVTDPLTGLFNRVKLDDFLESELKRAERSDVPFSVVIIDIDRFKAVNDSYGHLIGDTILIEFGKVIQCTTRAIDIAGRWGGEEFLIICPSTSIEGAYNLAEKLRSKIESQLFSSVGRMTASFGVSTYQTGDNIQAIVHRADEGMYLAKNSGRNRVNVIF